jgi:Fe-Mn family superoxide dismutase
MEYKLPPLPYPYDGLEPFIDRRTVEIHYSRHHAGYVKKLNELMENLLGWRDKSVEEILASLELIPEDIRTAVKNNAGGHYNHSLYWQIMAPAKVGVNQPEGTLKEAINLSFGSFDSFADRFSEQAGAVFGSGWTWLTKDKNGLRIMSTSGHDCPLSLGLKPILVIDVWEHAYYLKYENRRSEYISAWWNLINWPEAGRIFSGKS